MTTTGIYTYDGNFSGDLGLVYSKPTDSIGYFNNATPKTSETGTGLVYGAIAVSSGGDKMITALYGGNVLTSTDAGVTWTFRTAPGSTLWRTAAISDNGSIMVVGGENTNVWTSTNSGVTWTMQTTPGSRSWKASVISPNGQTIAVGSSGNPFIYVSTNSGATWINRPNSQNGGEVAGIAIVYNAPSTILVTINGGYVWRSVDSGGTWSATLTNSAWGNIVTTADGTTMALAGFSNIQVSTDLGVNWNVKLSSQTSWKDVKVSSDGQRMVALSGSGHIWISTNAGTTWTQAQAYGPVTTITVTNSGMDAYLIDGVSNATIQMIRGNTYTLSINATEHPFWIQTSSGAYNSSNIYPSITNNGSPSGTITFTVPMNAPNTLYYVCQIHSGMKGIITITDSTGPGPGGSYAWYNAGVSSDLSTIVCLVWSNIYSLWKTTNLGTTWTRFEVTLGGGYIMNMDASYDLKYVIIAVNGDYIYTSTNSGTTYTRHTQSNMGIRAWYDVSTSQDGQILVAIAFSVGAFISTNSGNTWLLYANYSAAIGGGGPLYLCSSSSTGEILYIIVSTGQAVRSTNFGSTFDVLPNSPYIYWQSFSTSANGMVLLGGNRNQAAAYANIFFSTNMGDNWTTIDWSIVNPLARVRNTYMSSSGQYMIIGSNSGIYISTNTGSTWRQLNMSGHRPVISDNGQVIIVASSNTIQISIDGGNTVSKTLTTSIQQTFLTYENDEGGMNISQDGRNFIVVSRFSGGGQPSQAPPVPFALPGFIWRNNQYVIPRDIGTSFQAYTSGPKLTSEIKTIFNQPFGVDWIPRGPGGDSPLLWFGVATSANGKKMVACLHGTGKQLYTSTNSGATWIINMNLQTGDYTSVSSSADGSILLTGSYAGFLYVSTNSGVTWTEKTANGARRWWKTGVSSNGNIMVGCPMSDSGVGRLYVSGNSGVTWTQRITDADREWTVAPAFSLDGSKILVADSTLSTGYLWISTDSGTTWSSKLTYSPGSWSGVASSSDGTKLAACTNTNGYISTDSGITWTTTGPSGVWRGIVSSLDGTRLAGCSTGYIYISTNSGVNWTTRAYSRSWNCIAASSDLTTLVATIEGGLIWTSTITPVDIGTFLMPYTSGAQKTIGLNITTLSFSSNLGNTWSAPSVTDAGRPWDSLAASFDGKILIAGSTPSTAAARLFMSTDSGVTWTENSLTTAISFIYRIFAISCSNDGKIIAVGVMYGTQDNNRGIVISTDSGKNWRQALGIAWIFDVDMSYDGQNIVVSSSNAGVRTSVDFGVTWTYRAFNTSGQAWYITSSGNGSIVYLYGRNIGIKKSIDYGVTGFGSLDPSISNTGNNIWRLATSSSGNIIAYTSEVGLRISTNGGSSWTSKLTNITTWVRISMSNDGSIISAAATGAIYISTDTGVNWSSKSSLSTDTAAAYIVALSGDGSRILASKYNEYLYTSTSTTSKQVRDIGSIFNNI